MHIEQRLPMKQMKRRFFVIAAASFTISIVFVGCRTSQNKLSVDSPNASNVNKVATRQKEKIKVGVTLVPAGEIMKFVKDNLATQAGLDIEMVVFNDGIQPNLALRDGQIDVGYFQHIPHMEDFGNRYNIKMYAFTPQIHLNPLGLFSKRHKSLNEIPREGLVSIPDDVSNTHRALKLMEEAKLIKLKSNTKFATVKDIIENPKNLQIKEIPLAQSIPSLPDVDLAAITGNWVVQSGMRTDKDALALESAKNPIYAVTLTTLSGKENEPKIQSLYKLLRNDKVKDFIKQKYQGAVITIP
ncbi:MAG: MetQ/NlpA family ABC transporter substrate-binding protein [Rhizonema sp. PD38]|nr:MetQ/NlpA family ABC transporter substrate-binding protein [Rhizonema sp. PD38]